jgi:hypothetical protein
MSVPSIALLIHAFIVGRVEKIFISPAYKTRYNLLPVFLNDNHAASRKRDRLVRSRMANKYNYDLETGPKMF